MREVKFKEQIEKLKNTDNKKNYITRIGTVPVLLTAPHTMGQQRKDGSYKLREPYTKAISMYIAETVNCSYIVKNRDTGVDSNSEKKEKIKKNIIQLIEENNIKLLLDIHGASEEREFDIELGNLNNLGSDFLTIKELKKSFEENVIKTIEENNPFKGGGITKIVYGKTNIDVIQIEINKKYKKLDNIDNIYKVCNAIVNFINKYMEITNGK